MKKQTITILTILLTLVAQAQSGFQIMPEFNLPQPLGNFSGDIFAANIGYGAGLNIDKPNLWKKFGLGFYTGFDVNHISLKENEFPRGFSFLDYSLEQNFEEKNMQWKSWQAALGPFVSFDLSDKLSLQMFSKVGVAKLVYPEYRQFFEATDNFGNVEEINLFSLDTPQEYQNKLKMLINSGLKINYMMSDNIGINLGAKYTYIKGVVHSYTAITTEYNSQLEPEVLYEQLYTSSQRTILAECNISSIVGTVGLIFFIDGKDHPNKSEEIVDEYQCQELGYIRPGLNDVVILNEKSKVTFVWEDYNSEEAQDLMDYEIVLFIKTENQYQEVFRAPVKNNKTKIDINLVKSFPDNSLFWQIVPITPMSNQSFCPFIQKKMKLWVFEDRKEAENKLPECKQK